MSMNFELNQTNIGDWKLTLVGEQLVFGLLGKLLFEYPERDWYQTLAQEAIFDEIPLAAGQPDVQAGMALLSGWHQETAGGLTEEQFEALRDDYTRLFIGPGKVLAPPWESPYIQKERVIFQVETLKVREWYQRFGLESVKKYKEPDDHIGLELAFAAHLASLGLDALEQNDQGEFTNLIAAQKQFFIEHPLKWVGGWSKLIEENARTDFFKGIALITKGVLAEMVEILDL